MSQIILQSSPLKTYSIFDINKSVFDRNSEMLKRWHEMQREGQENIHASRKLSNLQIRDWQSHGVTLHVGKSRPLYWSTNSSRFNWEEAYVKEVKNSWPEEVNFKDLSDECDVSKSWSWTNGQIIGLSKVNDYIFSTEDIRFDHVVWLDSLIWKDNQM